MSISLSIYVQPRFSDCWRRGRLLLLLLLMLMLQEMRLPCDKMQRARLEGAAIPLPLLLLLLLLLLLHGLHELVGALQHPRRDSCCRRGRESMGAFRCSCNHLTRS